MTRKGSGSYERIPELAAAVLLQALKDAERPTGARDAYPRAVAMQRLERYRKIKQARKDGLSWDAVCIETGMSRTGAMRFYKENNEECLELAIDLLNLGDAELFLLDGDAEGWCEIAGIGYGDFLLHAEGVVNSQY
jgi:hypothetical protein